MPAKLNDTVVRDLPAPQRGNRVAYFAGALVQGMAVPRGFGVNVNYAGTKTFVLNYRIGPRERRLTLGRHPEWNCIQAVREARTLRQRIDRGEDPLADRKAATAAPETPNTVNDVLDDFVKRHVAALRTGRKVASMFDRLVRPAIGGLPIYNLKRRQIIELLDRIEEKNGPVQVDRVLAHFGKALRWYAIRDDEFANPIVPGMARNLGAARERVLSDDEVRLIWSCLPETTYGEIMRLLLLTAQRRGDIAEMRWTEIADGVLTIPASRYKTDREHKLPLSAAALEIINRQPRTGDLVFTGRRGGPFVAFDYPKLLLDRAVAQANGGIPAWRVHDLRRTGRSLMARAGVRPDIAERVLGHSAGVIERTYDRHDYIGEMRHALEALASLIERIISPPGDNVVNIRAS